jgi:bifunctional non-homologous end joining protein LigD
VFADAQCAAGSYARERQQLTHLRSRNDNDFSIRYAGVVKGLAKLPDETIIDGEVIALDDDGRPSFNILQNYGSSKAPVLYFVFDVMVLAGRDVMQEPLETRRELLEKKILPKLAEPVRYAAPLDASLPVLIESVKAQGLEGLVAKRVDSRYEAGLRSGAWQRMRVNRAQEFVIGGYTIGAKTFDALVFGYYEGDRLIYAARTRNGFTPVVREQLFKKLRGLEIKDCPSANLPEAKSGRWGAGLTAAKMKDCRWLKPMLVAQIEFLEWTRENHLRHPHPSARGRRRRAPDPRRPRSGQEARRRGRGGRRHSGTRDRGAHVSLRAQVRGTPTAGAADAPSSRSDHPPTHALSRPH